jgi:hypothetical protein
MHYRLGSHALILVKLLHMVSHFAFCPAIDRHLVFLIKFDNPFLHFIHHDLHLLLKPLLHPLVCGLLYLFTLRFCLLILVEHVLHRQLFEYILRLDVLRPQVLLDLLAAGLVQLTEATEEGEAKDHYGKEKKQGCEEYSAVYIIVTGIVQVAVAGKQKVVDMQLKILRGNY